MQVERLLVEGEAEAGFVVRQRDVAALRQRLVDKHGTKVGLDHVGLLGHYHELGERDRGERHAHEVAVDAAAVRHDGDAARRGERDDARKLGDAAHPHDVGLQQADTRLDQLRVAPPRVLVLARRKVRDDAEPLELLGEPRVRLVLVGHQRLLDPRQAAALLLHRVCERRGVRHVERHVAVEHQRELGPHPLAPPLAEVDVLLEASRARLRPIRQWELGAVEAHRLGNVRAARCGVARHASLGLAAEQRVDRLVFDLAQQVPQRNVDGRDCVHRQALARVVDRRAKHLLPDVGDISHVLALDKHREVLLDDKARRLATSRGADTYQAIRLLDFNDDGRHSRDAPAGTRLAVPWEARHRIGNRRVMWRLTHDPVRVWRVVDVRRAILRSSRDEGAHSDDRRLVLRRNHILVEAQEERHDLARSASESPGLRLGLPSLSQGGFITQSQPGKEYPGEV